MFSGPPLPLLPATRLSEVLSLAVPATTVGAWLRGSGSAFRIYFSRQAHRTCILASPDLSLLLRRCNQVALREGIQTVVLAVDQILEWRALQVVTATPHLQGLEHLQQQFPGLHLNADGLVIPVRAHSPEEVLSFCLAHGVRVSGTRILYSAGPPVGRTSGAKAPLVG
jgi:hypothetical protein